MCVCKPSETLAEFVISSILGSGIDVGDGYLHSHVTRTNEQKGCGEYITTHSAYILRDHPRGKKLSVITTTEEQKKNYNQIP